MILYRPSKNRVRRRKPKKKHRVEKANSRTLRKNLKQFLQREKLRATRKLGSIVD
uniref:Uncharacterized protein n=1 Tax=Anopheles epiroticus TaxID=199890 RepID=A0A182PNF6_9DIPT